MVRPSPSSGRRYFEIWFIKQLYSWCHFDDRLTLPVFQGQSYHYHSLELKWPSWVSDSQNMVNLFLSSKLFDKENQYRSFSVGLISKARALYLSHWLGIAMDLRLVSIFVMLEWKTFLCLKICYFDDSTPQRTRRSPSEIALNYLPAQIDINFFAGENLNDFLCETNIHMTLIISYIFEGGTAYFSSWF